MNTDEKLKTRKAMMQGGAVRSPSKSRSQRATEWPVVSLLFGTSHSFIGVHRCSSVFVGGFQIL
jgi:hypothetical protein